MTPDFHSLLDPRGAAASGPEPAADREPPSRGIPEVTRPRSRLTLPTMIAGAALVTAGFVYSVSRAGEAGPAQAEVALEPAPPAPPPTEVAPPEAPPPPEDPPAPPAAASRPHPQDTPVRLDAAAEAQRAATERRRSPLIVELGETPTGTALLQASEGRAGRAAVGSVEPVEKARARRLGNQAGLVVQGTLVPGVLETAINSDLPGLVRAVVAADVTSFDTSRVVIPRGSRLIGHYRSGLAIGQTRAFIVWSRLVTPEGLSVDLGSPGTDALGRAGLTGGVDRHFFERFGAALLLSVVGSGAQAAASAAGRGDDITINAAGDAARVAEAALESSANIPPTIRVRQGTPIRVLVARDLDFGAGSA